MFFNEKFVFMTEYFTKSLCLVLLQFLNQPSPLPKSLEVRSHENRITSGFRSPFFVVLQWAVTWFNAIYCMNGFIICIGTYRSINTSTCTSVLVHFYTCWSTSVHSSNVQMYSTSTCTITYKYKNCVCTCYKNS